MLTKLVIRLESLLVALAAILLTFMLSIVITDILARNLLGQPIRGVTEFLSQTLYLIVFLGLARAFRQEAFIRSDLIFRYSVGRSWKKGFELISLSATLFVFMLLTALTFQSLNMSFTTRQQIGLPGYFSFPEWPLRLLTFLGTSLLSVQVTLRWLILATSKG